MRSIIDVRADVMALAMTEGATWPAARVTAISTALAQPSPVDAIVAAWRELKDAEDPSDLHAFVLKGLSEQIVAGQFHGLAAEATTVLASVASATDLRAPATPPSMPGPPPAA